MTAAESNTDLPQRRSLLRRIKRLIRLGHLTPEGPPSVYALSICGSALRLSAPVSVLRPGNLSNWPELMQNLARTELSNGNSAVVVQLREHSGVPCPIQYVTVAL